MRASFKRNSFGKFTKDTSIVSIFHGTNSFLLEDELNESQWIKVEQNASILREQYTNGFLKKFTIKPSTTDNTFYIENADENPFSIIIDGYQATVGGNKFGTVLSKDNRLIIELLAPSTTARKDLVFLEFWFETLSYKDKFYKFGGQDTEKLNVNIIDDRMNTETSRRIQLKWRIRTVANGDFSKGINANKYDDTDSGKAFQLFGDFYVAEVGNQLNSDQEIKANGPVFAIPLFEVTRKANTKTITLSDIKDLAPKVALVGLDNAQATSIEVKEGTATNKYMTPALVKEALALYGLGDTAKELDSKFNLNNLDVTGFYKVTLGKSITNTPDAKVSWYIINMKHDETNKVQLAFALDGNTSYIRANNNGTWSTWKQNATTDVAQMHKLTTDTGTIKSSTNLDLNEIIDTGFYYYSAGSSKNGPIQINGVVEVYKFSNAACMQFFTVMSTMENGIRRFVRYNTTDTLSPWTEIESSAKAQTKATAAETNAINFAKSYGLGGNVKNLGSADANTITESGLYLVASTGTNIPTVHGYFIIHMQSGTNSSVQFAFQFATGLLLFARRNNGGSWESWKQVATTDLVDKAETNAINFAKNFGLGDVAKDISKSDLNNLDGTGFYRGHTLTNAPQAADVGTYFYVVNIKHSDSFKAQFATKVNSTESGVTWTRNSTTSGWSDWKKIATTDVAQMHKLTKDSGYILSETALDLNTALNTGFYYYSAGSSKNGPIKANAVVEVYRFSVSAAMQFFTVMSVTEKNAKRFVRYNTNSNGTEIIGDWIELETSSNAQAKANIAETNAINFAKSFGLGTTAKQYAEDLNNLKESGFFYVNTSATNKPTVTNGNLLSIVSSDFYATQLYFVITTGKTYRRVNSQNVWSEWEQIATTDLVDKAETNAINFAKNFGLGDVAKDISKSSLNDLDATGFYRGHTLANAPQATAIDAYFYVVNIKHSEDYKVQFATKVNITESGVTWTRHLTTSGWSDWKKVILATDLATTTTPGITQLVDSTTSTDKTKAATANSVKLAIDDARTKATAAETAAINFAKSYGLGSNVKNLGSADANTITESGLYLVASTGTNIPTAHGYFIIHMQSGTNSSVQFAFQFANSLLVQVRRNNGGSWESWKQVATTDIVQMHKLTTDTGYILSETALDLNTALNTGFYYYSSSTSKNGPIQTNGIVQAYRFNSNTVSQIFTTMSTVNMRMFIRHCSSGTWGSWIEMQTELGVNNTINNTINSYGLGDTAKDITNTDLNGLDGTGFYRGHTLTNAPYEAGSNVFFYVVNIKHAANYKVQYATKLNGTVDGGTTWIRINTSSTWTKWKQVTTNGDLGTLVENQSEQFYLTLKNGVSTYSNLTKPLIKKSGKFIEITGAVTGIKKNDTVLFTIPEGYRPVVSMTLPQITSTLADQKSRFYRLTVETNGNVIVDQTMDAIYDPGTGTMFWPFHIIYTIDPITAK